MLCANYHYNPSVLLEISRSVSDPMGFGFYINNIDKDNSKVTLTVWNLVFTGCNCTCKHLRRTARLVLGWYSHLCRTDGVDDGGVE